MSGEWLTPQTIIQGGGVVVALALVWLIWKLETNHYRTIQDLAQRSNEVIKQEAEAQRELSRAIREEIKTHQAQTDCITSLSKAIDRLQTIIDNKL